MSYNFKSYWRKSFSLWIRVKRRPVSLAYRETMRTMEQQIKPVICPKPSLDVSTFFFSSVERKRVKKKTVFRAHKEDFCHRLFNAVPCMRSPPFSRRVKAIPFVPRAPWKKNDPLKGDGRRSGDVPRKGCRRTGCTPFVWHHYSRCTHQIARDFS